MTTTTTPTTSSRTTTSASPTTCPRSSSAAAAGPAGHARRSSAGSASPRWPAAPTTRRQPPPRATRTAGGGRRRRARRRRRHGRRLDGRGRRRRDPRGDGRPLPGRRLQRRQRAHRVAASSAATSPRSFGSASGVAEGVPLTVRLKVYDLNGDDATPLAGAAVYLWHCDREGSYSMYSDGGRRRELPARRPGGRRRTASLEFTTHLPGLLRRPLAAHALRGLRVASTTPPARPTSCAPRSSRIPEDVCEEVYGEPTGYERQRRQPRAGQPRQRHGLLATATRCSWPRSPARVDEGYVVTLNVPV